MYKTHNLSTGEFRVFSSWADVCRYIKACPETDEISYVKVA